MKLIKADEAFRVLSAYYHHRTAGQADALRDALDRVPDAVVRCGDCMMFDLDGADEGEGWCWWHDTIIKLNDYCSYGERRSDVRVYLPNR